MRDERREQLDAQKEQAEHQAATQAATQMAAEKVSKRIQNPDFLESLQDPDVDSEQYQFIENLLGARLSGQHILGHRSEEYERQTRWGMEAAQERLIAEGDPGRLCKGPLKAVMEGVNRRDDRDRTSERFLADERRAIRDAHDVAASMRSLSIDGKGIDSVATATTVTKREEQDEESQSLTERGANLFR